MNKKVFTLLLTAILLNGCGTTPPAAGRRPAPLEGQALGQSLTVSDGEGGDRPLPLAERGVTLVNFFGEFCAECATGERLETLGRLARALEGRARVTVLFAQDQFSAQDVTNFKQILPLDYPLLRARLEPVEPHLVGGQLLVALDAEGRVVWQERGGMSEQQIIEDLTRLGHGGGR